MLESVRRRLRLLIPFIEKARRTIVYTDFEDEIGAETEMELAGRGPADTFERFKRKARSFLAEHHGEAIVEKIRGNRPITAEDLAELQRVLVASGVGTSVDVVQAQTEAGGFGLFVGLDRAAAKDAFAGFLDDRRFTANQIEFVNLVIDELSANGLIEPRRFYESPFTDISPHGPEALFQTTDVVRLLEVVAETRRRAQAHENRRMRATQGTCPSGVGAGGHDDRGRRRSKVEEDRSRDDESGRASGDSEAVEGPLPRRSGVGPYHPRGRGPARRWNQLLGHDRGRDRPCRAASGNRWRWPLPVFGGHAARSPCRLCRGDPSGRRRLVGLLDPRGDRPRRGRS